MNNISLRIMLAFIFPFILFVVSPLTFYFGNINEVSFSLQDIWLYLMVGLFSVTFFIFLLLLKVSSKLYLIISGLLIGSAIAAWAQSQLFVWDFGPLDGRGIDWTRWTAHMVLESVFWLFIISICLYISLSKKQRFINLMVQTVFILSLFSIFTAYITAPEPIAGTMPETGEIEKIFQFHPEKNVIVILLDTFQSDYFEMIAENHPQEVEFLDGFTFYRNTIGSFPTTMASMPAIMTTQVYDNQKPFNEFVEKAYDKFNLKSYFSDKGFSSEIVSVPIVVPVAVSISRILKYFPQNTVPEWVKFIDYGLFRAVPTLLKSHVYNTGNWFFSFLLRSEYPPGQHGDDLRFLNLFEQKANVKGNNNDEGAFRFYHFFTPHFPLCVDEKLAFNTDLSGKDGYERQARGALKIAKMIIDKLHELDIYHSSEIVIMADHGTLSVVPIHRQSVATKPFSMILDRVHSSSLSLLLHKPPNSKGAISVDDSPLYLKDLACLIRANSSEIECSSFTKAVINGKRKRTYFYYDWKHEFWKRDFVPDITEYYIDGHAYDLRSWQHGKWVFMPGSKTKQYIFNYSIGDSVFFTEKGDSHKLIYGAWSGQESTHRWTEGKQALLFFKLEKKPKNDLKFRFLAAPYLAQGNIDHQKIKVYINDKQMAEWVMTGEDWYEAPIPAELSEGPIKILFDISNPLAPSDFGHSSDPRKLGIAAKEMVIVEEE